MAANQRAKAVVDEATVELKPCPFCGDPMEIHYDTLRHRNQGDCLIGKQAWVDTRVEHWNHRV